MSEILVVHVENRPGVLNRVASLFRRRTFNIDSLTVGRTETAAVSRMTIVVDTDPDGARRVEAHLYKLVNVLRVENITTKAAIVRDLAMIKVASSQQSRPHILDLVKSHSNQVDLTRCWYPSVLSKFGQEPGKRLRLV